MIQDTLQLNTVPKLFLQQTAKDLEFIDSVLEMLTNKLLANTKFLDRKLEADGISDTEWQFSQLLGKFSRNQGLISPVYFPNIMALLSKLKAESTKRQKLIDEAFINSGQISKESLVSHAELNELLGVR
jgi:hypothetical protein